MRNKPAPPPLPLPPVHVLKSSNTKHHVVAHETSPSLGKDLTRCGSLTHYTPRYVPPATPRLLETAARDSAEKNISRSKYHTKKKKGSRVKNFFGGKRGKELEGESRISQEPSYPNVVLM